MKIPFSPKVFGAVLWGVAIGLGGAWYYMYSLPNTVRADLEKSGVVLLHSEDDYRGIFQDQKAEIAKILDLKQVLDTSEDHACQQIKNWCEVELDKRPIVDKVPETHRQQIINICSTAGIKTNRGHLAQLNRGKWIEDRTKDQEKHPLYKTIFSIYKFYPEFLKWLTSGKGGITSSTKIAEGYTKLQDRCIAFLTDTYTPKVSRKALEHAYWWCSELPYKTVLERMKIREEDWNLETNPDNIVENWSKSELVRKYVNGGVDTNDPMKPEKYLEWCTKVLAKELSEENIYQEEYVTAKIACRAYKKQK